MCEGGYETRPNRIGTARHNDWNGFGSLLGGKGWFGRCRYDNVNFEPDQFGGQSGKLIISFHLDLLVVNYNVLSLDPAKLAQPLPKRVNVVHWRIAEKA
jgi:hypothetical protein